MLSELPKVENKLICHVNSQDASEIIILLYIKMIAFKWKQVISEK